MVVGHIEVAWGLELKLEEIKVSDEREGAVKRTYRRVVSCCMVVGCRIVRKKVLRTKVGQSTKSHDNLDFQLT